MKRILAILLLSAFSFPTLAADNYTATAGSGLTFRAQDVGAGILSNYVILGNTSGASIYGTAGTANVAVLTIQGIASGTAVPVSLTSTTVTGTVAVTQSGTWTVQPGNTANSTPWLVTATLSGSSNAVNATLTAETTKVIGTVNLAATPTTNLANIDTYTSRLLSSATNIVAGSALATTSFVIGSRYLTTPPTFTNGQEGALQISARGELLVTPGVTGFPVTLTSTTISGTVAATQSGTWNIGTVTTVSSATLAAETTKVIGTVRILGNAGAIFDGATGAAVPANALYQGINVAGNTRGVTGLALGTTFSPTVAIVDASGNQITSFGGAGGTASNYGSAFPSAGTAIGFTDGTNMVAGRVGDVNNVAAATTYIDALSIGRYNATQPTLTDTRFNAIQLSSRGEILVTPGVTGFNVTNTGTFVTQSAITAASGSIQSGAVASGAYASGSIAAGAQVDLLTMRGTKAAGTAAANSILIGAVFNTTQPTLTDGQQAAIQVTSRGEQLVATGTSGFNVTNAGTFAVQAAQSGTWNIATVTAVTAITNALPAGTNVIGHVITDTGSTTAVTGTVTVTATNLSTNVAQINGVTPLMGNGATGTGSPRVTISNDNTVPTGWPLAANQTAVQAPVAAATATATKSVLLGGQFDTTQKTLTNGQQAALSVSSRGAVFVATGADTFTVTGAGGTFPITAASGAFASGALSSGSVASGAFASGALASGSIAAGAQVDLLTMRGTKAPGVAASNALLTGAVYNSGGVSLTDTQQAALQLDSVGSLRVNVIASIGIVAQGSTTSGQSGMMIQGAVTTAAPSYTTAQTSPLSLDTAGNLRVSATLAAETTKVIGTVRNLGNGGATLDATLAAGTAPTNGVAVIGQYNSSAPTLTTGQTAALQLTSAGSLHTTVDNANTNGQATMANSSPVTIASNQSANALWGHGVTGVAVPANAQYVAANTGAATTGGKLTGLITCDNHVFKHITSATDTLAVQGVTSQIIYICGWRARAAGVATWFLENTASVNANCSSTLTQITGVATEAANTGEVMMSPFWTGLKNTVSNGLCINSTGTGGVDVDIWYTQF